MHFFIGKSAILFFWKRGGTPYMPTLLRRRPSIWILVDVEITRVLTSLCSGEVPFLPDGW